MRLINADELKKELLDIGFYDCDDGDMVIDCINSMPTIDPIKRGRWIPLLDENYNCYKYKCSVCGAYEVGKTFRHCYNCGARMVKRCVRI